MFEHMHPDDVPRAAAAFTRLVGDPSIGMVEDIELRKRHEDGSWRWLQITATNLLDHPQVGGILLNCRDVTDHKQAEFALAQTQARLDAALWGARVGLYTIDLVEDRAHMSPQFFEITGIDPIEWQADAHPWKSRIHPRDLPNVIRLLQAHIAGALDAFDTEYRLRTPQGWMWVLDRARVTERAADGRALTLSGTVIDISARKRLERELVEIVNREQLRLSQELHDGLGQELTGIALLLRSALVPGARKSAATDKTVDLAVAHLNNSIRTARTLAYGLYPVSSDQGGLLGALKALAENSTQPRALQVNFDTSLWVQRALPDDVANHIYRIAQEALGNAMRHARGSQVLIQLAALPDALTLRVRDNGRGLPDRALHAPGLGRRIMTYRAQMIGGSIEWVSPAGGGTEVLLSVPWPAFAPV